MSPSLPAIRRVSMLVLTCLLFQFLPVHSPLAAPAVEASAPVSQEPIERCTNYSIDGDSNTFIEAERYATASGDFERVEDDTRSGGAFMRIPIDEEPSPGPGMTMLTFNIDPNDGGEFYVWLLGYGPDAQSDSFFLQVDDDARVTAAVSTEAWGWSKVADTVTLSGGTHTFIFTERESGSSLDKLLLTKDSTYEPSGLGEDAISCDTPAPPREQPPRPPVAEDTPAAPDTARAALLEAIVIVDELAYDGPPASAPECSTRDILRTLQSAVDGTFLSDNFLAEEQAYDAMDDAVACLQAILADDQVDDAVQDQAQQTRDLVLAATRLIPDQTLAATELFGTDLPSDITTIIDSAQQEIATGDDHLSDSAFAEAIAAYRAAWSDVQDALNQLWTAYDPDADFLLDEFETAVGTSTTSGDTDGDGISDGDELLLTGTDPLTDDSSSDLDNDGLTAAEEVAAATNPIRADTDSDSLDDRFELEEFNSDPRLADTDADGLRDDSEFRLGTDPRNADSDGDGTLDGAQSYTSEATSEAGDVAVELTGIGDVAGTVTFQQLISNTLFQDMPGQIGTAVDITADAPFEQARVEIDFDPADVPDGDVENLRILYYDEDEQVFKPTDGDYGVDASTGVAWAETSHFTTFVLFYIPNWQTVWTFEMEPGRDPTDPVTKSLDMMLVIDDSPSMQENDLDKLRVDAAISFIDALLPDDRVGFVEFDFNAQVWQGLTTQTETVKLSLENTIRNDGGGTCIGRAIDLATQEIVTNSTSDRLKAQIVLTDGFDSCTPPDYTQLISDALAADIQLYTIGLLGTGETDEGLLQRLADETGGQYYTVTNAIDLPDVFRRISEEPDPDLDTDGDGLPNWLETEGIRTGTGEIVTTDPAEADTDGDGLSDGEEVGTRQTGPDGDYYDGLTDPTNADTDGDFITDFEEVEIGTNPVNADTDGDTLDDLTEINADFDPFATNPDGDHLDDAEEYARDTDPFSYDLRPVEYVTAFIAGFFAGEGGPRAVNLGLIKDAQLRSVAYIGGWLASGLLILGDIRDTVFAIANGDIAGSLLNAIGLIPALGDGTKVVRVFTKYIEWFDDLRGPLARWAVKQFGDAATAATLSSNRVAGTSAILAAPNPARVALEAALRALGWGTTVSAEVTQFARARNNLLKLDTLLKANVRIFDAGLTAAEKQRALARVNDPTKWDLTKNTFTLQEAIAVEGAVEYLQKNNYTVLYVQRNLPVAQLNTPGRGTVINNGPDILATRRIGGVDRLVVVETKGGQSKTKISGQRLATTAGSFPTTQLTRFWLSTNAGPRYLNRLQNAQNPNLRQAAQLVQAVNLQNAAYDGIIFGGGPAPTWGKIDDTLDTIASPRNATEVWAVKALLP